MFLFDAAGFSMLSPSV